MVGGVVGHRRIVRDVGGAPQSSHVADPEVVAELGPGSGVESLAEDLALVGGQLDIVFPLPADEHLAGVRVGRRGGEESAVGGVTNAPGGAHPQVVPSHLWPQGRGAGGREASDDGDDGEGQSPDKNTHALKESLVRGP